jgi:Zn-dependent protease
MNLALAAVIMSVAKVGLLADSKVMVDMAVELTQISLLLCFFNLLPIPPLDGSHLLKHLVRMSDETYYRFSQFGFIAVILMIQLPPVRFALGWAMAKSFGLICLLYGIQ